MIRLITILLLATSFCYAEEARFISEDSLIANKYYEAQYALSHQEQQPYKLIVSSAYGTSILKSNSEKGRLNFLFPVGLSTLKGTLSLRLLNQKNELVSKNTIVIYADTSYQPVMQAFCGPKQILVGGEDYTAVIGTVIDSLDNPYPEGTPVEFQYRFKGIQKKVVVETTPLYSYHRFFSSNQTGYPVISVSSNGASFEDFELTLYAQAPVKFNLIPKRDHDYADGKQVTLINTSRIMDKYGNSIGDGSLVDFKISTSEGRLYRAQATTINGVATAYIPAPTKPVKWTIQAAVDPFVESYKLEILPCP